MLFFVFAFHQAFSQEIKGRILDHSHLKAIPYASVYYHKEEVGTYADSTGRFSIRKILGDTLMISAMGFEKYLIPVDKNTNTINISLVPLSIDLKEVVITEKKYNDKKKTKSLRIGNLSAKHHMYTSGLKGRTIAYLVKTEATVKGQIKSIQYSVNHFNHPEITEAIVSAHLYTVDPNTGKPKDDLLINAGFLKVRKEDKILVVDLAHLHIELPVGGVYIGLEWLGQSPWYTLKKSAKPTTVYTKFLGKDWQLYSTQKRQTTSSKNGKKKVQQAYFEEPNFSITLVY